MESPKNFFKFSMKVNGKFNFVKIGLEVLGDSFSFGCLEQNKLMEEEPGIEQTKKQIESKRKRKRKPNDFFS